MRAVTMAAVGVALALACGKLAAYWLSGAVTLLASALDSALDASASLLNALAVRYALKPADEDHRFGHGKSESLAGMAQAAIIGASGVYVVVRAVERLLAPQQLTAAVPALLVMVVSLAATLALVFYQQHVMRLTNSIAVSADMLHYVSDLASNAAALLGLGLARLGWLSADPWLGLLIALATLYGAARIAAASLAVLMDQELPGPMRARIEQVVLSHQQVRGLHALRTRRSGATSLIQLHLELDPHASLAETSRITHEVTAAIEAACPGADVIIHQDPADQPCASGSDAPR